MDHADNALLLIAWLDSGIVTIVICTLNFIHPDIYLKIADTTALAQRYIKYSSMNRTTHMLA